MRFNHFLKPNENTEIPTNILVVDTEARIRERKDGSQVQTFRLGYAIHLQRSGDVWYRTEYPFSSIEYFWSILERIAYKKKRLYVVAHNMAYDYAILKMDSYLSAHNLEITLRVIDSVFIIKAGNLFFISSTNFYQKSLKELGKIFGIQKFESPDFKNCKDEELAFYCAQDTLVLASIMEQHIDFIKSNDLGCFKPTIAGQAMNAYRHRFMKSKMLVHNFSEVLSLEKESYRGGRCEAFRIGSFDDIYGLDINSMYPFVMKTNKFPVRLIPHRPLTHIKVRELQRLFNYDRFLLANCNLKLKQPIIACRRDKLIFPIGKVRQTITSPEIEYILNHPESGSIESINGLVTYEQESIFSEYVDYFYNLRKSTSNEAYKATGKLMMNSLYGKFGQQNRSTPKLVTDEGKLKMYREVLSLSKSNEINVTPTCRVIRLGDSLYQTDKIDGEFSRDAIPIIASAVTSYARVLLFELMVKSGLDNVYYCDTDSLFVNRQGFANLQSEISESELGKMKLVEQGKVEIRGAKDYTFNGKVKLKGVKANAELLPDGSFKQYNFQTKHSRYSNGSSDGEVILTPVIKHLSRSYDKGIVESSYVRPFELRDW